MTQTLRYLNDTGSSGTNIQEDVDVDGVSLLNSAGDVTGIVLSITWTAPYDWQHSECYVTDPDYNTHYIFSAGSLPFGSGQRTDTLTIVPASFPTSIDGTWEFYLDDQMGGSNTLDEISVDIEVTSANMPATYGETAWWNGEAYAGGIDLTNNAHPIYPQNGATIVADSGSGGSYAYSFDGVDDVWSNGTNTSFSNNSTMSLSAWLKHDGTTGKQMIFCNHGYVKGNFQLYRDGDALGFYLGYYDRSYSTFGAGMLLEVASVLPTSSTWYHVAAIFDGSLATGSRLKLYVDDVQGSGVVQSYNGGLTTVPSSSVGGYSPPQAIGGLVETATGGTPTGTIRYSFDGLVDDARAWPNTVLTADDLTWLASARGVAGGPPDWLPYFAQPQTFIGLGR